MYQTGSGQSSGSSTTSMSSMYDEEQGFFGNAIARTRPVLCVPIIGCLAIVLLIVFCSIRMVPAAHLGLVVTLGRVHESTLSAGTHLVNPMSQIKVFSTKTTLLEQRNHVPTKEGLSVDVDVAILFRIQKDQLRKLFLTVGQNFVHVLIAPELASAVRSITSKHRAQDLYNENRDKLQKNLTAAMHKVLQPRGITLENALLKELILPLELKKAIEAKAQAQQAAERMTYVIEQEKQEAARKKIEAQGISDFQDIVSKGISPALLQWKGIEATKILADSANAKVIIVGNNKQSLPVLFSG